MNRSVVQYLLEDDEEVDRKAKELYKKKIKDIGYIRGATGGLLNTIRKGATWGSNKVWGI